MLFVQNTDAINFSKLGLMTDSFHLQYLFIPAKFVTIFTRFMNMYLCNILILTANKITDISLEIIFNDVVTVLLQ